MHSLEDLALPPRHAQLLKWFSDRAGTYTRYPGPLDDGSFLVSRPKGIYKPRGWEYALSVRINLNSPYQDGDIVVRHDGSWFFSYHQEGTNFETPDNEFTNRALFRCIDQGVPVGILREIQVPRGLPVMYEVVGLAIPRKWHEGYFLFQGLVPRERQTGVAPEGHSLRTGLGDLTNGEGHRTDWQVDLDTRIRTLREIVARRGQPGFRRSLLAAYDGSCAVTGTRLEAVLEGAHLRPYRGGHTNALTNGLLLRTDVHTLMDLRLLAVHPETRTVTTAHALAGTEYQHLHGRPIAEPTWAAARPSTSALNFVWNEFLAHMVGL